jgi:hypothetical protein
MEPNIMADSAVDPAALDEFFRRWEASGAAERANYSMFLNELCDLLDVPRPDPAGPDDEKNAYVFERAVPFPNPDGTTTVKRIDLYKRDCFVLEAKQGSNKVAEPEAFSLSPQKKTRRGTAVRGTAGWDAAMYEAKGQAELYVRNLPASEHNPPFITVVDVGHTIELFSDFSRQGRTYIPFPDPGTHRIKLRDLADEKIRERLKLVWIEPLALDPSRRTAKVTREVAAKLAELARSLEQSGYAPDLVAHFLMRCLFTFFAEDVGLLPQNCFTSMLTKLRDESRTDVFPDMASSLWATMKTGGFSPILLGKILRFNGSLFEQATALPLNDDQLGLLIDAGEKQWREVEPAIFGTLLERALDKNERHKLGAHFTPRAYVERLVLPTIVEPLREQWANVQAAAVTLAKSNDLPGARKVITEFLEALCATIILDPACGTANFLYVAMEHMKRLEGEVWDMLRGLGETQSVFEGTGHAVDPHQFLGIEINPRAAAIAELVLWIGYLQWHFRTFGARMPAEPIIKPFHNIECRDAVLEYDRKEPVLDGELKPVTRWDGRTFKKHSVTGEDVPDESARTLVYRYANPRKAAWPKADYVVGNPPFLGNWTMRTALGDGYAETLRSTYPELPESVDYVTFWWQRAAELVHSGVVRRFGLITTNSIRQTFGRRVIEAHIDATPPISLVYAVPDHPWVDDSQGADVRIAMTVGTAGKVDGLLERIVAEETDGHGELRASFSKHTGRINADLTVGVDVTQTVSLHANERLSCPGVKLHGSGFIVTRDEAKALGLGTIPGVEHHIRPYLNGRDLNQRSRKLMVIDLLGLSVEDVRTRFPEIHQRLLNRVKPERQAKASGGTRDSIEYAKNWWLFGKPRNEFRPALKRLNRYIATTETSRHRFFVFVDPFVLSDNKLIMVALDDGFYLGVLSSRSHVTFATAAGGWLGIGNDSVYVKTRSFETFPFPDCTDALRTRISGLGEALDAHRKRQQSRFEMLTMTDMYNVLAKLRSKERLTEKEKNIHEQGLVSGLKQIHDDLDAAVSGAYGWPQDLSDDEILRRLVELNRERAEEEKRGGVRWLRPEYQNPQGAHEAAATQSELPISQEIVRSPVVKVDKRPWPKTLPERAQAVRAVLAENPAGLTPEQLAQLFMRANSKLVSDLLQTLVSLGQARDVEGGRYVAT